MTKIKSIIFVVSLIVISLILYISLLFSSKLNINEVVINPLGSSSVNSDSVVTMINSYKGKNLLRLSEKKIISNLKSIDVVKDATINKIYPNTLEVNVNYGKIDLKLKTSDSLYFYENGILFQVDQSVYDFYHEVGEVEFSSNYLKHLQTRIEKEGSISDLTKLVELTSVIQNSGLSENMKYIDSTSISSFGFGTLDVLLKNNCRILINAPITVQRLIEVLDQVSDYEYNLFGLTFNVDGTRLEQVENLINRSY